MPIETFNSRQNDNGSLLLQWIDQQSGTVRKIRTATIQIFLSNKINSRSNNLDKATLSSLSDSLFISQIIILFFFFLYLFLKLMSLACHLYKNLMAFVTFSRWYFFRQLSLGQNCGTIRVCVCVCVCVYAHTCTHIYITKEPNIQLF